MDLKIIFLTLSLFAFARGEKCTKKVTFPMKKSTVVPGYPWTTTVFGLPLFFTEQYKTQNKINHVASVWDELLDNDQDGCADDPAILKKITTETTCSGGKCGLQNMMTFLDDLSKGGLADEAFLAKGYLQGQTVGVNECLPGCGGLNYGKMVTKENEGEKYEGECIDATIEESFHMLTSAAIKKVYPKLFNTTWGSKSTLTKGLDKARNLKVYPKAASKPPTPAGTGANPGWWYAYTDQSCFYDCQAVEYIWQGFCAYSGMCNGVKDAPIDGSKGGFKWQTKELLKKDKILYSLFENSGKEKNYDGKLKYVIPTRPVDGIYTGCNVCKTKATVNHGGK